MRQLLRRRTAGKTRLILPIQLVVGLVGTFAAVVRETNRVFDTAVIGENNRLSRIVVARRSNAFTHVQVERSPGSHVLEEPNGDLYPPWTE
jgi:hypothetical protein